MCRGENNMQRFIAKNWATDSVDKVHRRAGPKPIHRCEPCLGQLCDLIDIKEFWADYLVEIFCKRSDRKATDDFIKEKIASLQSNWTICDHVIFDQNNTPKVKNIIATLDASNPTKLLVVVRNYQRTSKTPSAEEVEAVVPKAIILYTLKVMDELLCKAKEVNPELTLEVIFTDSLDEINGSEQFVESLKKQGKLQDFHFLLDLNVLGRSNPKTFATSETTKVEFDHIRAVEKRLKEKNLLVNHDSSYFNKEVHAYSGLWTESTPFQSENVATMRLLDDNIVSSDQRQAVLDQDVCNNILRILAVFLGDYLCQ